MAQAQAKTGKVIEHPAGGRMVPQANESEQSTLGAMLLSRDAISKAQEAQLTPSDFYRDAHQKICAVIYDLNNLGFDVDIVLVIDELRKRSQLEEVGGPSYLTGLISWCPTPGNVKPYIKAIKEKSLKRRLLDTVEKIATEVYENPAADERDIVNHAEKAIFEVTQASRHGDFTATQDVAGGVFSKLKAQYELPEHEKKTKTLGMPSGFADLDSLTNGFKPGNLVLIAARPSMGKTSLAMCMACHVAVKLKLPVAIFSLEMTKEELVTRLISYLAEVNGSDLQKGLVTSEQWARVIEAVRDLQASPLYIDDTEGTTVPEMRSKARRLSVEVGQLALVVVDYIGLIQAAAGRRRDNLVQELGDMARGLKGLAVELKVALLCLAQLSRGVENREIKKPELSDLRDSGNLEEHADVVAFIYRESYYADRKKQNNSEAVNHQEIPSTQQTLPEDDVPDIADILIKKHRNGPTGNVKLNWHAGTASFTSVKQFIYSDSMSRKVSADSRDQNYADNEDDGY